MDKLKRIKTLYFLLILAFIAFLFGTFFITIISNKDINLVKEYIYTFINNIEENKLDFLNILRETLFSNIFVILLIWLFGISIIGIPFIIIYYFFKMFSLGFLLSSFILTYKLKGIIFSLIYIFPNELIKFFGYTLLVTNAIKISKRFIKSIFKKEKISFQNNIKSYIKVLIIVIIIFIITSVYETFAIPFLYHKFNFLIKWWFTFYLHLDIWPISDKMIVGGLRYGKVKWNITWIRNLKSKVS